MQEMHKNTGCILAYARERLLCFFLIEVRSSIEFLTAAGEDSSAEIAAELLISQGASDGGSAALASLALVSTTPSKMATLPGSEGDS